MKKFIKFLSSPLTHILVGLFFWLVPFLSFYFTGRILDSASCVVGALAAAGISCFDFGLSKLFIHENAS